MSASRHDFCTQAVPSNGSAVKLSSLQAQDAIVLAYRRGRVREHGSVSRTDGHSCATQQRYSLQEPQSCPPVHVCRWPVAWSTVGRLQSHWHQPQRLKVASTQRRPTADVNSRLRMLFLTMKRSLSLSGYLWYYHSRFSVCHTRPTGHILELRENCAECGQLYRARRHVSKLLMHVRSCQWHDQTALQISCHAVCWPRSDTHIHARRVAHAYKQA